MKLPFVSREAYELALERLNRAEQQIVAVETRYKDMIEKFSAQLTGMVKEGFRTPPSQPPPEPPYQLPSEIQEAILEVAGNEPVLQKSLEHYAYLNRRRPVKTVAQEIRTGG